MKSKTKDLRTTLAILGLLAASLPASAEPVSAEQLARIAAALPAQAPATPAKPRRLLVYTQTKGFRHASIECGAAAITLMGERTGAYKTTVAAEPDVFSPDVLRRYDAILFLSTTGDIFTTVESQKALLDYVRRGGGIVGIHAATDCCYKWPEWGRMMGGFFDGHPWTYESHVTLWIEEPDHPLNAAFGGRISFPVQDEIYQLRDPYSRKTHRVLISLDTRRTDMTSAGIAPKIKRTDGDFAISQLRTYRKGRVFYCALGHNHHIFWDPAVLGHYLAGIQWAMGDLKADATPRPRGEIPLLSADPALFDALETLDYATSQQPLDFLDQAIAEAGADRVKLMVIEQRLLRVLGSPDATFAARQAVCQRLAAILPADPPPSHPALAVLAPLLNDENQFELARLALDPVPGATVDALYLEALNSSRGPAQLALVQSVGHRRITGAVLKLASLAARGDKNLAAAAIAALGRIGTVEAAQALDTLSDADASAVAEAKLACLRRLPAASAIALCQSLSGDSRVSAALRAAAFHGLLEFDPAATSARIIQALDGDEPLFKEIAFGFLTTPPDKDLAAILAAKLGTWDAPTQAAVITALGCMGDAAAVPEIIRAAQHDDAGVRSAAIGALGRLPGSCETARLLAQIAAGPDIDEARLARQSLAQLDGPEVTDTVIAGAENGEPALRVVFLDEIGLRHMTEAVPLLLKTRADPDASIRAAALGALAGVAPATEQRAILDWAAAATDATERTRALRALISVTIRNADPAGRVRPIVQAIDRAEPDVALRLLPVLPRLGGADCAECLGRLALRENAELADAAASALARWTGRAALFPLVTVCEQTTRDSVRTTALKGAIQLLDDDRGLSSAELTAVVSRLLAVTRDPAQAGARKRLVFLLGRGSDELAEALAEKLRQEPGLAEEARDAAEAIRANRAGPPALRVSAGTTQRRNALDGKLDTSWSVPVSAEQWLEVDFKLSRPIRRLTLDQTGNVGDYPEHYEIYVTDDPKTPGEARASGKGERQQTVIDLPAGTRGRFVIIKNTAERKYGSWTVSELFVD